MDSKANRPTDPLARISIVDRLDALVRHPKRLLAAIVALLVAAGAAVGSSAVLTSSSTNPGNSLSAANLPVANNNAAVISATGLVPGQNTGAQPITITNDGDLSGTVSLSGVSVSDTAGPNGGQLSSALTAHIVDTDTASPVYDGPARNDPNAPISLGTWAAGEAHHYTIQLSFPHGSTPATTTTGDNAFQSSSATLKYEWKATQQ